MKKYLFICLLTVLTMGFAEVALADTTDGQHAEMPHQSYAANTDACASCHSTHTANGPKLLIGSNTYQSCTMCHDGTESVYDVLDGEIGSTAANTTTYTYPAAPGGMFGTTGNAASSRHQADDGTNIDLSTMGSYGGYSGNDVFNCASCHDPHKKLSYQGSNTAVNGGFNSRLLKAAPKMITKDDPKYSVLNNNNGTATITTTATGSVMSLTYGILNIDYQKPVLYEFTAPNTYVQVGYASFDPVTHTFSGISQYTGKTYKASFWPKGPQINISYGTEYRVADPTKTGAEVPSYPVNLNEWCGTCHNDYYLSTGAKVQSGDYTSKYRHAVGTVATSNISSGKAGTFNPQYGATTITATNVNLPLSSDGKVTCLTCHYAHGSKATSTISSDTVAVYKDNGDSTITQSTNNGKLLRLNNRDTCEFCHQK